MTSVTDRLNPNKIISLMFTLHVVIGNGKYVPKYVVDSKFDIL